MNNIEKVETRITAEKNRLNSLYKRRDEISDSIKESEKKVAELETELKTLKLTNISGLLEKLGIGLDDFELAAATGDFSDIQKAINGNSSTASEVTDERETNEAVD